MVEALGAEVEALGVGLRDHDEDVSGTSGRCIHGWKRVRGTISGSRGRVVDGDAADGGPPPAVRVLLHAIIYRDVQARMQTVIALSDGIQLGWGYSDSGIPVASCWRC